MWQIFAGVFGLIFGSAANALIDRLPSEKSWVSGRSECDNCRHKLEWQDLLPVVSYAILGGRCRYCHSPIPIRNLLVEIFLGCGFWVLAGADLPIVTVCILAGMLWVTTVIAVMDWETKLVSEVMVGVWGILGLGLSLSTGNINLSGNLYGMAVGLIVVGGIWAASRGRAMGFGDVEVAAVMGWWLSLQNILVALWVAFVTGAAIGLIRIAGRQAKLKSEMAFGPFLVLGAWAAFIWGERIWRMWGGA